MSMRYLTTGVFTSLALLAVAPTATGQEKAFKRTELLRAPVEGMPGKEIVVWTTDYPPGSETPLHTHPGQEVTYVIDGAVVLEPTNPNKAPSGTRKAGEAFNHPIGEAHVAKNASATEPSKVLIIMITDKSEPIATDVK